MGIVELGNLGLASQRTVYGRFCICYINVSTTVSAFPCGSDATDRLRFAKVNIESLDAQCLVVLHIRAVLRKEVYVVLVVVLRNLLQTRFCH